MASMAREISLLFFGILATAALTDAESHYNSSNYSAACSQCPGGKINLEGRFCSTGWSGCKCDTPICNPKCVGDQVCLSPDNCGCLKSGTGGSTNCPYTRSPDRSERSFYEVRDGVLIRVWRNVLEPEGFGRTQVIVPISLRPKIIHVAHDVPSSGHLGTQKTLDRVLRHFYWPGIFKYVREYCRTCDVCQRLGKGATKARAPLINLPVIDKPWSRIALDIVGPLDICDKSEICMGDTSQMVNDCKALLSMDSVMTTVVCEISSHTNFSNESSSNVAVMYMNVDCGERVILVSTVVLLQLYGQMTNGLNDVFTQVVTIMPCTQRGQLLHESMDVFGCHVLLTEECMHDDILESSFKMESGVEQLNVCLADIVHECHDIFLESDELLPDIVQDFVDDEVVLNECLINEVHDTYDVSLDLTGISMEIVGIGCLEPYLCAQVYFQNVSAMMELLVGDECRLRRRVTRRGSKGLSAFVFLWMGLTVVTLLTCDTWVTRYTAFYVFLPSADMDVEVALVGLLAALRAFEVYLGVVPLVLYTDSLRKFGCEMQRCSLKVGYRPSRLNLFSDLVCRFTFGD